MYPDQDRGRTRDRILGEYKILRERVGSIPTDYTFCCDKVEWIDMGGILEGFLKPTKLPPPGNLCPDCFKAICSWHDEFRPILMTPGIWNEEIANVPNL